MSELGNRLKQVRGELSQSQFSASLGITQTKLSRLERGESEPDLKVLNALASVYKVSLDWLIAGCESLSVGQKLLEPTACSHCEQLKADLMLEREERRELAKENRQLHRDKMALVQENGDLRVQLARLEERLNQMILIEKRGAA